MEYTKQEAIKIAKDFIRKVNKLEKEYDMTFNSDTGDIYFSYKSKEKNKVWDYISLGWIDDGNGIKVIEETKIKEKIREQALNKLTDEEREALGL